jgi:hypothetical protein
MSTIALETGLTTFDLHRVDEANWLIRDHAFGADDARHLVACVHETPAGDVEVIWLRADVSLPTRYSDAVDALVSLMWIS